MVLNLTKVDQKVWGDFKVQFKSSHASFYFWLNVSAILYNSELRKISKSINKDIHFEEFVEIDDSDNRDQKNKWLNLLIPQGNL